MMRGIIFPQNVFLSHLSTSTLPPPFLFLFFLPFYASCLSNTRTLPLSNTYSKLIAPKFGHIYFEEDGKMTEIDVS